MRYLLLSLLLFGTPAVATNECHEVYVELQPYVERGTFTEEEVLNIVRKCRELYGYSELY